MTVNEIARATGYSVVHAEPDRAVERVYCGDLLSVVMSRAPAASIWVTVIGNVNTVAVASLAEISCIVLAEGFSFDPAACKAADSIVTLLQSPDPVYETAQRIGALL